MRYAGPSPQGRFPPPVARWAAVCAACLLAGVASAALSPRQVRDQLKRFQPAAARLAVEDLKNAPGYDYAAHRSAVERLVAGFAAATNRLARLPPDQVDDETATLVEGYRQAILANPLLDFGRILCVRRRLAPSVWPEDPPDHRGGSDYPYKRRGLTRRLGLVGLNAHNHMDLDRTGFTNDIAVVSDFRATPRIETLWKPAGTEIVRDLDLDFDASRILFTSYRGTNNLLGVYEIKVKGERRKVKEEPNPPEGTSHLSPFAPYAGFPRRRPI